jgi:hypothetical protein
MNKKTYIKKDNWLLNVLLDKHFNKFNNHTFYKQKGTCFEIISHLDISGNIVSYSIKMTRPGVAFSYSTDLREFGVFTEQMLLYRLILLEE